MEPARLTKGAAKKRNPSGSSSPKKMSSNYFVLSDRIESDDEHAIFSKQALLTDEVPALRAEVDLRHPSELALWPC